MTDRGELAFGNVAGGATGNVQIDGGCFQMEPFGLAVAGYNPSPTEHSVNSSAVSVAIGTRSRKEKAMAEDVSGNGAP